MKLKYSWNKRQQAILRAIKEVLASPGDLVISAKSMVAMQHIMMNALHARGVRSISGTPGNILSNQTFRRIWTIPALKGLSGFGSFVRVRQLFSFPGRNGGRKTKL